MKKLKWIVLFVTQKLKKFKLKFGIKRQKMEQYIVQIAGAPFMAKVAKI